MGMGMRAMARLGGGIAATALAAIFAAPAMAQDVLGQPVPAGLGLQTAAAPLAHEAHFFHNIVLMPVITAICVLVLVLLVWIAIRYNKRANPTPAKWSHNTLIEVIWTVVPVLILVGISLFSFRLLFAYHDYPDADVTVKITGNQWNWGYEYPDQGVAEYISNMLPEDKTTKQLYRLAADEPMVVPVGENVRLLITASDVIHAVAIPAFAIKVDAVPGRMNETWFRAEKEGDYYGQCSELCGVDHAFMPIHVKVVSKQAFAEWVASKGGSMTKAADEAAAAAAPAAAEAPAAPAAGAAAPTDAAPAAPATAAAPAAPAAQ
ncbi:MULTISPECIES: cytochrome c oxidase subunit II [Brevundimonas]|uniref:Cytochrome c oxidase subunit 2 n=1 Tax=Brevundimonas naejangsanensis TaxID=588932 RepID=A0A172Y2Q6_9CAUL|nr:cytochrome c oxidase subunit II [Brevundimonas naejangsanensis]QBQ48853.1 cytochrome c oxidase subunit II [Brevundimonas naejangsanensis]